LTEDDLGEVMWSRRGRVRRWMEGEVRRRWEGERCYLRREKESL